MHQISVLLLSLFMAHSMGSPAELEGGIGEINQERFLFATKTVTNLVITTTTTNTLLRTWCYEVVSGIIPLTSTGLFSTDNLSDAVAAATFTGGTADTCQARRRRWSFENIFDELDGFDLSPAIPSSDQAAVNLASINMAEAKEDIIESKFKDDEKNPRFGLSLIHTVTQTLTAVSKIVTGTVVKKVLLTCTPQNLGGIGPCHGNGHK
ncbi:uncharacterized protein LOC136043610 [Artemia franciscana]|uniref:uncharacterized protein LOC136043610 n=1 Tax=Artemia franciscana TaxID=6661 RepID=UPI0032DA9F0A